MLKRFLVAASAVLATVFLAGLVVAADNTAPDGFITLFNGKDLTGWKVPKDGELHWKVVDGIIDYDGKNADLWSQKSYKDFTLMVDWRWSGKTYKIKHPIILPDGTEKKDETGKVIQQEIDEAGDSGIYVRGNSKSQINIWCWSCGSGEVYGYRTDPKMPAEVKAGVTPKKNMDKPIGEWNKMEITVKGDRLWVKLNGEEVITNAQLPGMPASGPIALQHHGNPIQFKNVYIKELN